MLYLGQRFILLEYIIYACLHTLNVNTYCRLWTYGVGAAGATGHEEEDIQSPPRIRLLPHLARTAVQVLGQTCKYPQFRRQVEAAAMGLGRNRLGKVPFLHYLWDHYFAMFINVRMYLYVSMFYVEEIQISGTLCIYRCMLCTV